MTTNTKRNENAAMTAQQAATALRRVSQARVDMLLTQPFFGSLAMRLDVRARAQKSPLATDGRTLWVSPQGVGEWTHTRTVAALAQAVMHCANGHPWRMGARDPKRWNHACDLAVNHRLKRDGFDMDPEWPADPQFADLAAEVIYSRMPPPQPEDDGDGDDGDGDGDGQRQEGGQGWQDGRQGASGQEGSADISPSDVEAPQPPADGSESGQEIAERLDAQWQMAVQQAVNAALQQGNVPASMQSAIDEMKRARGDWRNELRHLLHSVSHDDYTWRMPSQRYMARGLYLPSLRDERMDCAVFVRDTSGSISDDTLAKGNAEIFAAIDEVKPRRVIIMDCDAAVAKVWEVDEGDDVPELKQAFGRGGTSFVPPFDWLRERDITPAVLIYLTDLEGGFPAEPGFPTIWCATNRLTSPIGRTLHIL